MTFQRHIIRRQIIELEIPARMDRVGIQNRIARLFHDRLVPVIDRHLSLQSQPGSTERIERLEIDLGKLHISRMEEDLLERIEEALQTKLDAIKMDPEPVAAEEAHKRSPKGSDMELITYFLQTGAFPWWAVDATTAALEQAFENVVRSGQAELRRVLNHLFQDNRILQRCVYACSENILERIVEVCLPGGAEELIKAKQDLSSSLGIHWRDPGLRQVWWYCVIRSAVVPPSGTQAYTAPGIVQLFMHLAGLPVQEPQLMEDSKNPIKGASTQSLNEIEAPLETDVLYALTVQLGILSGALPIVGSFLSSQGLQQIIEHLKRIEEAIGEGEPREMATIQGGRWKGMQQEMAAIQKIIEAHGDGPHVSPEGEKQRQQATVAGGVERIKEALTRLMSRYDISKRPSTQTRDTTQTKLKKLWQRPATEAGRSRKLYDAFSDSDKLYVQNAGLVLLWPYLNRFFTNLGLSNDTAFIDEDAAERACLILQYLVNGDAEHVFEAQLPLNKIICGLDLYQPVNTQWVMNADEQEVADSLLEAVFQNAPLWKNLSPDGFRQAYLQREGTLGTRDGHWLLQVARETYDVMVDRLPWTIQVVKLPWMDQLIFVEWQQT